jgi:hypothetical protein
MKFIKSIFEATLDDDKRDINYALSRDGKTEVKEDDVEVTTKLKLYYTSELPELEEKVISIRPASLKIVKFSDIIKIFNVTDPLSELFIYKTTSLKFPFAIAKKGIKTNMIKQLDRVGASARGDYFRETVFVIQFAIRVWEKFGHRIDCFNHDGRIPINFIGEEGYRTAKIISRDRDFREKYEKYEEDHLEIIEGMVKQCDSVIKYLGSSVYNLSGIYKNSSNYSINNFFLKELKDERDLIKDDASSFQSLPDKINIAKWNPSDCWLVFKGYEWTCRDLSINSVTNKFKKLNISSLQGLNDFLGESIKNRNGLIGISLKQQTKKQSGFFPVNVDVDTKFTHTYNKYNANPKNTGTKIIYDYALLGQMIEDGSEEKVEPKVKGAGEIDVRSFTRGLNSAISLEVKGSQTAEHMSGKAGAIIKSEMPSDMYQILVGIRKEKDLSKISQLIIDSEYQFKVPQLKAIFDNDLMATEKTSEINSRLQAVFFTDWLEGQSEDTRNEIVSTIIRFAKSESDWSAPHTIVK